MKKLIIGLILSVFMSNHVFANIDESQTDLYYANGMLMDLDAVLFSSDWRGGIFFITASLSDLIRSSHTAFGDPLVKPEDDVLKRLELFDLN